MKTLIEKLVETTKFFNQFKDNPIKYNNEKVYMMNYYGLLIEISSLYHELRKKPMDRVDFIDSVFKAIQPDVEKSDIEKLFSSLDYNEKNKLEFLLNYYLNNLYLRGVVYRGLTQKTLVDDMISQDITDQKEYLEKGTQFMDVYLKGLKGSEYDTKRSKLDNAIQDLLWNRPAKLKQGASAASPKSADSKLTKKVLLERLKECEDKLRVQ